MRSFCGKISLALALLALWGAVGGSPHARASQDELPLLTLSFPSHSETATGYRALTITLREGDTSSAFPAKARVLGNETREKPDYRLRFSGEEGKSLLGLEASASYYLVGALRDRSLLRSYLGYTLAAQCMENTPAVRFCEVSLERGDGAPDYQGVYLLIEDNVPSGSYIFRRTTKNQGTALTTYGGEHYPQDGHMELPSEEALQQGEVLWDAVGQLSYIEETIYSENLDTFSRYEDLIDGDSFADFFIINELMGNYAAKTDAFYRYDSIQKKLFMGPVWGFEEALDNAASTPLRVEDIQFDKGGYFERLLRSRAFLERLKARYLELRRSILNEENYNALIDEALALLGPAMERDWQRWAGYHAEHEELWLKPRLLDSSSAEGVVFSRQAGDIQEEVRRVRYLLREHDLQMARHLAFLEGAIGTPLIGEEASYVRNTWLFVLFIILLAAIIHQVRRRAE